MSTKEELLSIINTNTPIYFASTHGAYDITNGEIEHTTVPPNTYVFEASSVGEATLTTIDTPLWEMIQNRNEFIAYLNSDNSATDPKKKEVFKNLIYYKPGDKIYKRSLVLEKENEFNPQWSYYEFKKGEPYVSFPQAPSEEKDSPLSIPPELPDPPYTAVMASFREEHFPPGKTRLRCFERVETGSNIRFINETRKRYAYAGPAIFIFSSCAVFWPSSHKESDMKLILEIGRTQQLASQQFSEMGFTSGSISGENGKPVLLGLNHKNSIKRSLKRKTVLEQFSPSSRLPDNLQMTSVEDIEKEYMDMVGKEITRFVRPRFNNIVVPPGAATIFVKISEGRYDVAKSASGKTWWTYQEIEKAIDDHLEIYVYIGGDFIQLKKKAGIYTAALKQHSKKSGGTRRFLKKSKGNTLKNRKSKRSL